MTCHEIMFLYPHQSLSILVQSLFIINNFFLMFINIYSDRLILLNTLIKLLMHILRFFIIGKKN